MKVEKNGGFKSLKYLDLSKQHISIDLFHCILRSCPSLDILLIYDSILYIDNKVCNPFDNNSSSNNNYYNDVIINNNPFILPKSNVTIISKKNQINNKIINIFGYDFI